MRFLKYSFIVHLVFILCFSSSYASIRYVAEGKSLTNQSIVLLGTTPEESKAVESIAQTVYLCALGKQHHPPFFLMEWDENSAEVSWIRDASLLRREVLPHYIYSFPELPEIIQGFLANPLGRPMSLPLTEVKGFSTHVVAQCKPALKPYYVCPTLVLQDCAAETFLPTKYFHLLDDRPTSFHQLDALLRGMQKNAGLPPATLLNLMKLEKEFSDRKSLTQISLEDLINDIQDAHDQCQQVVGRATGLSPEIKEKFIARLRGQKRSIEELKELINEKIIQINENHKDIRRHISLKSSILAFLQEWWHQLRDSFGCTTREQQDSVIDEIEEFHTMLEYGCSGQSYLPLALEVFYYHRQHEEAEIIVLAPVATMRRLHTFLEKCEYTFDKKAEETLLESASFCTAYLADAVDATMPTHPS